MDSSKQDLAPIGQDLDLVSALVEAEIVDVSSLSRVLASRRLVVVEDKDQTILKTFDKALGSPLFSPMGESYVLPAKGVGNFRAISDLGKVLQQLLGTEFEIVFLQDRDGAPDWLIPEYLESNQGEGRSILVLGRHEIESYLLEPALINKAATQNEQPLDKGVIVNTILECGEELKAKARRTSRETAKQLNRFLPPEKKEGDADLDEHVDKWFDALDFSDVDVVRTVAPGKELLKEVLKKLNEGMEKPITRGQLVSFASEDDIPKDLLKVLGELAGNAA